MSTVLLTGANRGLGLGFAEAYAGMDWQVIACCREPSSELKALGQTYPNLRIELLDVADHAAIDALAEKLKDLAIDVLLNNAGTYGRLGFAQGGVAHQSFGNTDYENWEQVLRVNVFGPMKMAEAFVAHVEASEQKKIVTLSSMLGSMGLNDIGGMYAYRTSKAAVNMMMHSMGTDLAARGIISVALHPGWARTDMGGPDADIDPAEAVSGVVDIIRGLNTDHLGQLTAYDGSVLPY